MAHSLEVRAPLVDHLLVERMAELPGALKMRGFRGKQLLRRAVADLVPREVLTRRKRGFNLPLGRWLREELRDLSYDLLTDETARTRGLLDPVEVRRLIAEHRAGIDHGERLWNLTVLELWLRDPIPGRSRAGAVGARRG
jgi:asparagine synthase (glutamine-hydrolysing)